MSEAELGRALLQAVEDHRDRLDDETVINALQEEIERVQSTAKNRSLEAWEGES